MRLKCGIFMGRCEERYHNFKSCAMENSMANKPLLTLTMIVKDEAATLAKTLRSVKPYIDRWVILDTGSTDGTQTLIHEEMADIPGELYEEPFVDFATTRNLGLDCCGHVTEWILYLDADDDLQNAGGLRDFLKHACTGKEDAFGVHVRVPEALFPSTRIIRSTSGYRFFGVVHEVLMHPSGGVPGSTVPNVVIDHRDGPDEGAHTRKRWERDVDLLENDFKTTGSHRSAFYHAMTLYWLGRYGEAIISFTRRIALGGWSEEVFCSLLNKARATQGVDAPPQEWIPLFTDAHSFDPRRAEPLWDIAEWFAWRDDHALTVLFARRAFEMPKPAGVLFLEEAVYDWKAARLVGIHAWYVGAFEVGERAALAAHLARPEDEVLANNWRHYVNRRSAL